MSGGKLRIAIIGAGKAGAIHASAFSACSDCDIVRVMSRSRESARRLADTHGIAVFGDCFEDVIEDDSVDAVVVASPDSNHCAHVLGAVGRGKHVMCEKPLATSIADAEEMTQAAESAGVVLMVGFTERYNHPCLNAKTLIEQGTIGRPVMMLGRRCHPKSTVRGRTWLNDEETGGVINYVGTHNIDLACWFMGGCPTRVYAEAGRLVLPETQGFTDSAVITLRFPDGGIATLYESFGYPDPYPHGVDRSIEILGSSGLIKIDLMQQPLVVQNSDGMSVKDSTTWPLVGSRVEGAAATLAKHFIECVRTQVQPLTSGRDGIIALKVAAAAVEASRSGTPQTL